MHEFTRQPSRYDIPTIKRATAEAEQARIAREERAQLMRLDAVIRQTRASRPWPVRIALGLIDVVREWRRG